MVEVIHLKRLAVVPLLPVVQALACLWLGGCSSTGPVLTTPDNPVPVADQFPNALLAEPIRLRAGYVHLTQPFEIKGPEQTWSVEIGFVRDDQDLTLEQKKEAGSIFCWTDSPVNHAVGRTYWHCRAPNPGLNLRWELISSDGTSAGAFSYNALVQPSGGTTANDAITVTLSGFRNQPAGQYRLRVTVLRDFPELDFAKPHILVNQPFFRKR